MLPASYPFRAPPEDVLVPPRTITSPLQYLASSRAQREADVSHGLRVTRQYPNVLPKLDDSAKYADARKIPRTKGQVTDHRSRKAAALASAPSGSKQTHFKPLGLVAPFQATADGRASEYNTTLSRSSARPGTYALSTYEADATVGAALADGAANQALHLRGGSLAFASVNPEAAAVVLGAEGALPLGLPSPLTDPMALLSTHRPGAPALADGGAIMPGFVAPSNRSRPVIPDGGVVTSTGRLVGGFDGGANRQGKKGSATGSAPRAGQRGGASHAKEEPLPPGSTLVRVPGSGPVLTETVLRPVPPPVLPGGGIGVAGGRGSSPGHTTTGGGATFFVPGSPTASLAAFSFLSPGSPAAPAGLTAAGWYAGVLYPSAYPHPTTSLSLMSVPASPQPQWQQYVQAVGSISAPTAPAYGGHNPSTVPEEDGTGEAARRPHGLNPPSLLSDRVVPSLPTSLGSTGDVSGPAPDSSPRPGTGEPSARPDTPLRKLGFDWSAFASIPPLPRVLYVPPLDRADHAKLLSLMGAAKAFCQQGAAAARVLSATLVGSTVGVSDSDVPYDAGSLAAPFRHAYPTPLLATLVHDLCEEVGAAGEGVRADLPSAWLWFLAFSCDARVIMDCANAVVVAKAGLVPPSGPGAAPVSAEVLEFLLKLEQDVQEATMADPLALPAVGSPQSSRVVHKLSADVARAILPFAVPLAGVAVEDAVIRMTKRMLETRRLPNVACVALFVRLCLAFAGWGNLNVAAATLSRSIVAEALSGTPAGLDGVSAASLDALPGSIHSTTLEEAVATIEAALLEPVGTLPSSVASLCEPSGVRVAGVLVSPTQARAQAARGPALRRDDGASVQCFDRKVWSIAAQARTRGVSIPALEALLHSPTPTLAAHFSFLRECLSGPPTAERTAEAVKLLEAAEEERGPHRGGDEDEEGAPHLHLDSVDLLGTEPHVSALLGYAAVGLALHAAEEEGGSVPGTVRVAILFANSHSDGPLHDPASAKPLALHTVVSADTAETILNALGKAGRRLLGPTVALKVRQDVPPVAVRSAEEGIGSTPVIDEDELEAVVEALVAHVLGTLVVEQEEVEMHALPPALDEARLEAFVDALVSEVLEPFLMGEVEVEEDEDEEEVEMHALPPALDEARLEASVDALVSEVLEPFLSGEGEGEEEEHPSNAPSPVQQVLPVSVEDLGVIVVGAAMGQGEAEHGAHASVVVVGALASPEEVQSTTPPGSGRVVIIMAGGPAAARGAAALE